MSKEIETFTTEVACGDIHSDVVMMDVPNPPDFQFSQDTEDMAAQAVKPGQFWVDDDPLSCCDQQPVLEAIDTTPTSYVMVCDKCKKRSGAFDTPSSACKDWNDASLIDGMTALAKLHLSNPGQEVSTVPRPMLKADDKITMTIKPATHFGCGGEPETFGGSGDAYGCWCSICEDAARVDGFHSRESALSAWKMEHGGP